MCDGTGAYILLDEVATAYEAAHQGQSPDLTPLDRQPTDFALWHGGHLTDDALRAQVAWWAQALDRLPLGSAVPFDHTPGPPTRRVASLPVRSTPPPDAG